MAGSALSSGIGGAEAGAKADKLRQAQQDYANQRFAAGAPFRSKLAALALKGPAQREDLSALVADPGNPYARVAPRPSLTAQAFGAPTAPSAVPSRPPVPAMGGNALGGGAMGPMGPVGGAASGMGGVFGKTVGMKQFLASSPGMQRLMAQARANGHPEPDADQTGGPSDMDQDNAGMPPGMVPQRRTRPFTAGGAY